MDENSDHNQSGLPVKGEEDKTESDIKQIFDQNSNSQAAGALEMSEPVNNINIDNPNAQQTQQMV